MFTPNLATSEHVNALKASAEAGIKKSESRMLISGIIIGIMAVGTIMTAYYYKDILDFSKDYQAECLRVGSILGIIFLSNVVALVFFTYKRSICIHANDNPYEFIRKNPLPANFSYKFFFS